MTQITKKPIDMYDKQVSLAEQQYQQQQDIARQKADRERQSITEQLSKQRQDYLRSQQTVEQQGFQQGRNLLSSLANRGLATSGLLQLGDVQNRMVQGQTLSNLAEANRDVFKAGIQAQQDVESNLQESLRQAGLDLQRVTLQADESMYQRGQGERQIQAQLAQSLLEASMSPDMTPEKMRELRQLSAAIMGYNENPDAIRDAMSGISSQDPYGDSIFKEKMDWGSIGKGAVGGAGVGLLTGGVLGAVGGAVGGAVVGGITDVVNRENTLTYNIPDIGKVNFNTDEQGSAAQKAQQYFDSLYANREYSGQIKSQVSKNGKIVFITPDGNKFDTYNKAANYFRTSQGW